MEVNMTDIIAQWEAPFDVYCDCLPEDMQGTVQELAAMSDEEFFQHMMDQMGINGGLEGMLAGMGDMGDMEVNMADIIAQWEAPFDVYCDCLPTDMEHGNIY